MQNINMSSSNQPENVPATLGSGEPPREATLSIQERYWSGPLPSPATLNQYDPATIRSIVAMAEKEQSHRHGIRDAKQRENSKARSFGFVFALISMIGGMYLISAGKMVAMASVLVMISVGELVSALVFSWLQKIRGKAKTGQA